MNWADHVKGKEGYQHTKPFHYMNNKLSFPYSCDLNDGVCMKEGCLLTALANYTTILMQEDGEAHIQQEAVLMILHLMGDLHNPMHCNNEFIKFIV